MKMSHSVFQQRKYQTLRSVPGFFIYLYIFFIYTNCIYFLDKDFFEGVFGRLVNKIDLSVSQRSGSVRVQTLIWSQDQRTETSDKSDGATLSVWGVTSPNAPVTVKPLQSLLSTSGPAGLKPLELSRFTVSWDCCSYLYTGLVGQSSPACLCGAVNHPQRCLLAGRGTCNRCSCMLPQF